MCVCAHSSPYTARIIKQSTLISQNLIYIEDDLYWEIEEHTHTVNNFPCTNTLTQNYNYNCLAVCVCALVLTELKLINDTKNGSDLCCHYNSRELLGIYSRINEIHTFL